MAKKRKTRNFKTEYIPVYISSVILILFVCLLVLVIGYEGKVKEEPTKSAPLASNEELAINKTESKCSEDELKDILNLANGVSGDYKIAYKETPFEKTEENESYWYSVNGIEKERFTEITIKGITEGIYVEVSNDYNKDVVTIRYSELNEQGEYSFASPNMDEKINFVVSIYADKYNCTGEVLRKVGFETKIYNFLSARTGCIMYPNYENCAEFVDKLITPSEFMAGYEKYAKNHKEYEKQAQANYINAFEGNVKVSASEIDGNTIKKNITNTNKVLKKLNDNKELILISIVIIGIGLLIVVLIMFIRRHRL